MAVALAEKRIRHGRTMMKNVWKRSVASYLRVRLWYYNICFSLSEDMGVIEKSERCSILEVAGKSSSANPCRWCQIWTDVSPPKATFIPRWYVRLAQGVSVWRSFSVSSNIGFQWSQFQVSDWRSSAYGWWVNIVILYRIEFFLFSTWDW